MTAIGVIPLRVLDVEGLSVSYRDAATRQRVVHGVSFHIDAGETVALVGESGSGKTTTAQAILGLLAEGGRIDAGAVRLNGTDITRWPPHRLDAVRGARISLIPQDPGSALDPVQTIGRQVAEILEIHRGGGRRSVEAQVIELLARVGLPEPARRAGQYPHQLSGGMKQRVLIAIAMALRPALIVADEPTSALDVTVQRRILDLIDELRRQDGTAMLLVTHDLGVAADRADRLVVMRHGRIQEQGGTTDVIAAPRSPYTRQLLVDRPGRLPARRPTPARDDDAIVVDNLAHDYIDARGAPFRALDDVSFRVLRGTTHAIVGESGSGKTTLVRAVAGLQTPSAGRVLVDGIDLLTLCGEARHQFRGTVQLVYQNPFGSLDPRQSVSAIIEEPLLNFAPVSRLDRLRRVREMAERVGLPEALLDRRPRALSGGQRQRVAIARALVRNPAILVLDEAVSALDVTVQAQVLALLDELQRQFGLTYLFVSHDLAVVRQIADTVSVLYRGRVVDGGPVEDVFARPTSAYTRELIDSIPGRRLPAAA